MSTIPASIRESTYNPVGATGPWGVGFPIFDPTGADLVVSLNGVEQTFGAVWTITPGTPETGFFGAAATWPNAVIYSTIPMTGELVIRGVRDPRRVPQFNEGAGVPARDQNLAFNVLTAVDQELRRDVDREVAARISDVSALDGRMTAGENKNSEQDSRLGDIDSHQTAQDGRLDGLDAEQAEQNNRIGDIENLDLGDRVIELESQITLPNGLRLATIGGLEAAIVPASADVVEVLGFQAAGDGGGFVARSVPNVGPLQPGQFHSNINLRRWENAEDTITPAMFSDITEMFAFTKAQIQVPAASYEFDAPITTRAGLNMRTERGAVFRPTFEPVGADRAIPMITLGDGAIVDRLEANLVAGIDTIRTLVKVNASSRLGKMVLTSTDMNKNRTESGSTDLISGAVILTGGNIGVDEIIMSRFDRGLTIIDTAGCRIGKVRNLETIMGIYIHGSRDVHIHSGYSTGAAPALAAPIRRGPMTPGANSLVLAGCSDSSFSNWFAYDMLEHAVRVGGVAAGTSVPNHRLVFRNHQHYRPYGCGMKFDDADAFNIKRAMVDGLYTEDVGNGNWFGNPDYQNWASGGVNNPAVDNDGNKAACAIRNSQFVQVTNFMNRANARTHSGQIGFWVERSNHVNAIGIDTSNSRTDGVVVQSGGATSPEEITLNAVVTRFNGGAGLKYNATPSNATWRGVVTTGLVSEANTGYGIEVTGRFDGGTPYASYKSSISGRSVNNTAGPFSINSNVQGDMDFMLSLEDRMAFIPTLALADPGDSSFAFTIQTGRFELRGSLAYVEINLAFTPTIGTGSGNLRIGGFPMASASALNVVGLIETNAAFSSWNSRVELVPTVQNGSTILEIRGLAAGVGISPISSGNLSDGVAHTLKLAGHYRVF